MYYDQYGNPINIDAMIVNMVTTFIIFFFIAVGLGFITKGSKGGLKVINWGIALPFRILYWILGNILQLLGQKKKK